MKCVWVIALCPMIMIGLLAGTASGVQAALLAYEGFDYSSTTLSGANGGSGWSTSWKSDAALTADSTADVQTNSLAAPTGLNAPIAGSVKLMDPGGSVAAYRGLASSARLDMGVDATYYMSILAEKSNSSFTFGLNDATGASLLNVSASTGADVYLTLGGSSVNTVGTYIANNNTYLYVVKIVARATGNDQAFIQRYHTSQTISFEEEETTWLLTTGPVDLDPVGVTIKLFGGSDRTIQYDEIRLGTTWESVIAPVFIPPSGLFFSLRSVPVHIQSRPLPDFGIMLNDDGDFSYTDLDLDQSRSNLCSMIRSLDGTPVRTLVYAVATGDILLYPSEVGSVFGWRTTASDTNSPWNKFIAAAEAGEDAVRIAAEEAKDVGLYFIPALRMNDAHFVNDPTNNILTSEFWMDNHASFELGASPVAFEGYEYLLDYSYSEVREYRLAVINEVINRYSDVMDGLQLDFMRNPILFPANTVGAKAQMTDLIAAVRTRLDEAGQRERRFLSLHVRVPPSLSNCEWAGLDVEQWISERLVDVIVPSPSMTILHDMPIDEFVVLAQPVGAKVYPAVLSRNQFAWPVVANPDASDYEMYVDRMVKPSQVRGAAVNYLALGAAGFEMYNFNLPPYQMPDFYDFIRALDDPWGGDRIYMTPPAYWNDYEDAYEYSKQIPADVPVTSTTKVSIVIGDTLSGTNGLALRLGIRGLTVSSTNSLVVALNGTTVHNGTVSGAAFPVTGGTSSSGTSLHPQPAEMYVQWAISPVIVTPGLNEIDITLGSPAPDPPAQLVEAQFVVFE